MTDIPFVILYMRCKRKLNTLNYYLFVSKQNPHNHFSTV